MYNQDMSSTETYLQKLYAAEYKTFVASVAVPTCSVKTQQPNQPLLFRERAVPITPIYHNTNIYVDTVKQRGCLGTESNPDKGNGDIFFTKITQNILTLEGTYTIAEAIPIINNMIKKAGNNFYGVLLRQETSTTKILNPLHPLVARAILTSNIYSNTKFRVLVYFYPNRKNMDKTFKTYNTTIAEVKTAVTNLLRLSKVNTDAKVEDLCILDVASNRINSRVAVTKGIYTRSLPEEQDRNYLPGATYYTLPHQLLTRGNIAPYYGTSVLRLSPGSDGECCPVSPYLAANISGSSGGDSRIVFSNVCTGSQPKKTLEGLSTLNHSYLGSPLNRTIIRPGAMLYSDQCVDVSMYLYLKAGYISSYEPITKEPEKVVLFPQKYIDIVKDAGRIVAACKLILAEQGEITTFASATRYCVDIIKYLNTLPTDVYTFNYTIINPFDILESSDYRIPVIVPPTMSERRYKALLTTNIENANLMPIKATDNGFSMVYIDSESLGNTHEAVNENYVELAEERIRHLASLTTSYERDLTEVIQESRTQNNESTNQNEPGFIRQT